MASTKFREQFRLSDMLTALAIIGTFPLVFGETNATVRVVMLICAALFEAPAVLWACTILRTWNIEHFGLRLLVHLYTFAGVLAMPTCLVLLLRLFIVPWSRETLGPAIWLVFGIATSIFGSMIWVERNRVKRDIARAPRLPQK